MRSSRFRVGITVLWLLLLATGCAGADEGTKLMTRQQIEAQLAQEVPRGTPRVQVIAFLKNHHVENSSDAQSAPADQVVAIYRNVKGGSATVSVAVQVVFRFTDDKLESYSVAEKLTGP